MTERIIRHESMRGWFAYELHSQMHKNPLVWVVTADLGYGMMDAIRRDFPERFLNVGAAEQAGLGLSVGLAMEGKIPFFYSITPFLLYRPFEIIRNYLDREGIPVKLVGSGRDRDYLHDGYSHWADGDTLVMNKMFKNIKKLWPYTNEEAAESVAWAINNGAPTYINLSR